MTNEQMFRRLYEEAFNQGDLLVVDELVSPDFVEHQRGARSGPDGPKGLIRMLRSWFPDLTLTIEDIVISGDQVWGRLTARGTHLGVVMGKPPTGASIQIDIIDILRIEDGKFVEHWGVADTLGMLEQIGALPSR
ncbi:MAG TPA: ester cyclase [Ktedonobacterales bacterium]|jgi:predicted ester cyclase|nr:ester cyclase [Ktedonobacterales bacterium]